MSDGLVLFIMAGGAGTRFWPWSTDSFPKQFLQFVGQNSLLQETYQRSLGLVDPDKILVLTHENYRQLVLQQLPDLQAEQVLCEPSRRDTAAAVAYGALMAKKLYGNPVTVLLTADHWIETIQQYQKAIKEIAWGAQHSRALYTLGIRPTYPATGYGYLHLGQQLMPERPLAHRQLVSFKEKPALKVAEEYVHSGDYLWNSGMFAWQTEVILEQFQQHLPQHLTTLQAALDGKISLEEAFKQLEKISIDFAILEKAPDVRCVIPEFNWSDLGGWLALQPFLKQLPAGNYGRGHVYGYDSRDNLVVCEDPEESVAILGVSDMVIVRVGKKTLVLPKSRTEEIKQLLAQMPAEELQ